MRVFSKTVLLPLLLYLAFINIIAPDDLSRFVRVAFVMYAVFIFWIVWKYALEPERKDNYASGKNFFFYLLLGSVVFFVFTRIIMFIRYGEAPLGYDTGFYLQSVQNAFTEIQGQRMLRVLLWIPFRWLGFPELFLLNSLYILFQLLILGSLYTLARTLKASSRLQYAAVSIFLFAVSLPQFFAFWWMFYQMELAMAFLLMTIALIHRRSFFAIVTGAFGIAIHPATFFPFVVALAVFSLLQAGYSLIKRKRIEKEILAIMAVGIFMIIVVAPFTREFLTTFLQGSVGRYGLLITNYPAHIQRMFTGLYIDFELFHLANIYILPFAGVGLMLFLFRKLRSADKFLPSRLSALFVFLVILFILSYYPFVYQNRFLVFLDLLLIMFAAYSIAQLFQHFLSERVGRVVIGILIFGFSIYSGFTVWTQKPQLYPDELQDIKEIARLSAPHDYAMSTESLYTPWVSAFSERTTIDPGFLGANLWDYFMWTEFWYSKSDARRYELLNFYARPIYIFLGERVDKAIDYRKMIISDPHFEKINSHVYRYDPRLVTREEIEGMYAKEYNQ